MLPQEALLHTGLVHGSGFLTLCVSGPDQVQILLTVPVAFVLVAGVAGEHGVLHAIRPAPRFGLHVLPFED